MMRFRAGWKDPRVKLLLLALVLVLAMAACGGDDDPSAADDDEDTTEEGEEGEEGAEGELSPEVQAAADAAAEAGLEFVTSREELERRAHEEGFVRVMQSLSEEQMDAILDLWPEDYPDIGIDMVQFSGQETRERFLLELEADAASSYDIGYAPPESYSDYAELFVPYDLVGMSEVGILNIPIGMIDPHRRNIVAMGSQAGAIGYNPNLIAEEDLPDTWWDFTDERFDGDPYQFLLDIRPTKMSTLVAELGLDEVLEMAEALAAQDPLWHRAPTGVATRIAAGESPIAAFHFYHTLTRIKEQSPEGTLEVKLLEPVPVRMSETWGVFKDNVAENPHAALLFLDWMAGDVGQGVIMDLDIKSSHHSGHGGRLGEALDGMQLSVADFDHIEQLQDYMAAIVEAYGFPSAEID